MHTLLINTRKVLFLKDIILNNTNLDILGEGLKCIFPMSNTFLKYACAVWSWKENKNRKYKRVYAKMLSGVSGFFPDSQYFTC